MNSENDGIERNLGEQPIAKILADRGLKHHDLVVASVVPMTHKMVARACKGRRLTPNVKEKILQVNLWSAGLPMQRLSLRGSVRRWTTA